MDGVRTPSPLMWPRCPVPPIQQNTKRCLLAPAEEVLLDRLDTTLIADNMLQPVLIKPRPPSAGNDSLEEVLNLMFLTQGYWAKKKRYEISAGFQNSTQNSWSQKSSNAISFKLMAYLKLAKPPAPSQSEARTDRASRWPAARRTCHCG